MRSSNFALYGSKIILEFVRDIVYFPLWWYSRGLYKFLLFITNFVADRERALALFVWIKNIGRPMYGQHDAAGIIISFFVRLVQIIARSIIMLFWLLIAFVVFLIWLALPFFVALEIIFQLA